MQNYVIKSLFIASFYKGGAVCVACRNKVEVKIGGTNYTLVGTEAGDYLKKVALYIDNKMNEITRLNNRLSTSTAAVLTAANVADDFFKSQEKELAAKKQLSQAFKEIEKLREELRKLKDENSLLEDKNNSLQLEIVRRESEMNEFKSYQEIMKRQKYA